MSDQAGKDADVFAIAAKLQMAMEVPAPPADSNQTASPVSGLNLAKGAVKQLKSQAWNSVSSTAKPDVSIVIPVYNKADYTMLCLASLAAQLSKYIFEVVVVDNGSSDSTTNLVPAVPGIKYIRNASNEGFVGGCNIGVKHSRGKIVVLLNNDTQVKGGWLDALVDRLTSSDDIGIVGSKIVYPDGKLQEAGGIIFSDGSGHNYGKGQASDDFEYNFCRDVDYCSGASIAFYRQDFNKLGGFDERFAPAYYEDTDLAMAMRHKLGKRVVYEPHSLVEHTEGATAGTDTGSGFKRFQAINHDKFLKKWHEELSKYHHRPGTSPWLAARYGKQKRLLVVDGIVPEYDRDSGSLRMSQILRAAGKLGYAVTLFPANLVASQPYTAKFQSDGIEVVYGSKVRPREFYHDRVNLFEVIMLSRPTVAIWHLQYCQAYQPKARLLYDTVDLHHLRIGRQAKAENKPSLSAEAKDWKQLEYYLMDNSDCTLVVSSEEERMLHQAKPELSIQNLSNINPRPSTGKPPGFSQRQGLLFMGDYSRAPNITAAEWLVKEILPLVHKTLPNVPLTLLGSNPAKIESLAGPLVTVTGFVEKTDPYYNSARIFVCPLLYGAGVKGKVSESIAFGLPVISTAIGTEGMHLENGVSCLEAEDAATIAKQIIDLYEDSKLWQKLSANASRVYEDYFSEKAGLDAVKKALRPA